VGAGSATGAEPSNNKFVGNSIDSGNCVVSGDVLLTGISLGGNSDVFADGGVAVAVAGCTVSLVWFKTAVVPFSVVGVDGTCAASSDGVADVAGTSTGFSMLAGIPVFCVLAAGTGCLGKLFCIGVVSCVGVAVLVCAVFSTGSVVFVVGTLVLVGSLTGFVSVVAAVLVVGAWLELSGMPNFNAVDSTAGRCAIQANPAVPMAAITRAPIISGLNFIFLLPKVF